MSKTKSIILILLSLGFINSCTQDDLGDIRDNIVKTWRSQEESALFGVQYYDVEITKSNTEELQIIMYNFFDRKQDVIANMDNDSLRIPKQTIDGWDIEGSGKVSSDFSRISWSFTVNDGSGIENISAYFSEKSPVAVNLLAKN